jgi:predicted dehydrogenase
VLRTVVLGYGLAGEHFHGPLLATTEGVEVVGVLTTNPERQERAKRNFPDAVIHTELAAALDSGADLAVVAGANITHVPQARAALQAGMHVVVDKPLAPTADTVRELAAQAASVDRHIIAFQNRRWDSDFLTMLRIRDSGAIGDIHRFESRFGKWVPTPKRLWRDSTAPEDMGGNLYDLGAHVVDQAHVLFGPITSVTAHARAVRATDIANDDVVLLAQHANGVVSYLVGTTAAAYTLPRFLALGTKGSARIDLTDTQEAYLRNGGRASDPEFGVEEHGVHLRTEGSEYVEFTEPLERGGWRDFYGKVRDAARGEAPSPVPIEETVMTAAVIDAARESSATGRSVSISSTPTSST